METIERRSQFRIDHHSRVPKYQQLINAVIKEIQQGNLKSGDQIPSINDVREKYCLSRDTVEKAYNKLKEKKIIVSTKGKGNYVGKTVFTSKVNVLFLSHKISAYKMIVYNALVNGMEPNTHIDILLYHGDPKLFLKLLKENQNNYDHFVITPYFGEKETEAQKKEILKSLKQIPSSKLVLLDNHLPELGDGISSIYQDFSKDIYDALKKGSAQLTRYDKLILVYPSEDYLPYPTEILKGFKQFCKDFNFDFEVLNTIYPDMELQAKDAYVIIEETDLVNLIKQIENSELKMGQDIGVVSYNDTSLKELLGITVISTDFKVMGETAAYMINKKKKEVINNVFHFINRGSI